MRIGTMLGVALSLSLTSTMLGGCLLDEPDVGGGLAGHCENGDSDPDADVLFSIDIRPLFDRSGSEGGCGSCHNPGGTGVSLSGFEMSSMAAVRRGGEVSGPRIVVAGDPCSSILLQKLSAAPAVGARMPLSGPPYFNADQLRLVHDWIAEGAQDN